MTDKTRAIYHVVAALLLLDASRADAIQEISASSWAVGTILVLLVLWMFIRRRSRGGSARDYGRNQLHIYRHDEDDDDDTSIGDRKNGEDNGPAN